MSVDTAAAEAYGVDLVPGIFGPWASDAIRWAGVKPGDHVLDVACGPGVATWPSADLVGVTGRVVGLDSDPGMISVASALPLKNTGPVPEWHCASAQDLPFPAQSFDVVLCLQGLQLFPDHVAALREMVRVLRPGGRLLITIWCSLDYCKGYEAMVIALEDRSINATAARKPFSLGNEDLLWQSCKAAGLSNISIRIEQKLAQFSSAVAFLNAISRGAPSSRFAMAKLKPEQMPEFHQDVTQRLSRYTREDTLHFPMESYVIEAST